MKIVKSKHVGCYGVIRNNNQVLLIKKGRGAYKGKLDLPGGGMEYGESALDTLKREIIEEVGVEIEKSELRTIVTNYVVWDVDENTKEDLQHIGIIYDVVINENDIKNVKEDADGHDSLGAKWYNLEELNKGDLSPLAKCLFD